MVDAGAVPLLVLCVQEPEIALKRTAASALSDIAKHTPELALAVVDAQTIPMIAPVIAAHGSGRPVDSKLQRQILSCLSQIAKHTVDLAEAVVDGEIFPGVLYCLKDPSDSFVRRNAASLVCEISKHTPELAQLVVNSGGVAAMVDYLNSGVAGSSRLPAIMALGYIAAFNETLALAAIVSKGVPAIAQCLSDNSASATASASPTTPGGYEAASTAQDVTEEYVKAAACWSLGQLGRHSADHAKHLTDHSVLPKLLKLYVNTSVQEGADSGADLKVKAKRALKAILSNTLSMNALEPLLQLTTPPNILKYVIAQFSKILPHDISARRAFVTSGGLARVQEIASIHAAGPVSSMHKDTPMGVKESPQYVGSKLAEYIRIINECYPEEIVRYYSPGYSNTLLSKIDEFNASQYQQPQSVHAQKTAEEVVATKGSREQLDRPQTAGANEVAAPAASAEGRTEEGAAQ